MPIGDEFKVNSTLNNRRQDPSLAVLNKHAVAQGIEISYNVGTDRTTINLYVNNDMTVDATIQLSGNHSALTQADFVL